MDNLNNDSGKSSITIILPAYNEVQAIRGAYESTVRALKQAGISDYEILIITNTDPGGNHDGTPTVAAQIAKEDSHVRHIHFNHYVGLGFKYCKGVESAQKDYTMMVPGDNDNVESSMVNILKYLGKAPVVIAYTINPEARPFYIRFVSKGFVVLCNLLFGLRMKYYNGSCIYSKKLLQQLPSFSSSPAYNAEILIYLIKSGVKYVETFQEIKKSYAGKTFRLKSVLESIATLASLFWRINIKRERVKI